MQILLCAATEFEIGPSIDFLREEHIENVDVLVTGVGLTAATYALTRAVLVKRPDFIIQAGVAGCLDPQLPLTKVVLVANENMGDLGVREDGWFRSLFDLKLLDQNAPPWSGGKLSNDLRALKDKGLPIVDGVTVHEISTDKEQIAYYRDELHASVESMEGAALHYVALMEKIPFLQLRSLSNFAGERDKSKWVLDLAIASLNFELKRILTKIVNR